MSESETNSELVKVIDDANDDMTMMNYKMTVVQAEARAAEAEEKMRRAAEIGKDLLEKNMQMGAELDILQQEKHEINLRLQTKLNVEKSLLGEVENLRDAIRQLEEKREGRDKEEEERWAKREQVWKAKVAEAEVSLQTGETREKILQERLEVTERQLSEATEGMNQSVGGQTMSLELAELQSLLPDIEPGLGRTAREQAMIQLAVLGITLAFAVVGGLLTGYIIHIDWIFNILKDHELFEDHEFFAGIPTPEPIEDETPPPFNVASIDNDNSLGSI